MRSDCGWHYKQSGYNELPIIHKGKCREIPQDEWEEIVGMTRQEAIAILKESNIIDLANGNTPGRQAVDLAIEALSEPKTGEWVEKRKVLMFIADLQLYTDTCTESGREQYKALEMAFQGIADMAGDNEMIARSAEEKKSGTRLI